MPKNFSQPELELPIGVIKNDLRRTAIITVLMLAVQGVVYIYLQKGGWNKLLPILQSINL